MHLDNNIRKTNHTVFQLHVHLVFVTKYRRNVLTKIILENLKAIFMEVCEAFHAKLIEFNGETDHVHLLVNYTPNVALSILVHRLKGVSSYRVRKKRYPSIQDKLWGPALWSPSYFASSCGGAPIDVLRQYIEQQQSPH